MSVLIGMVIGLINGVFVIMLNVPSIIATLGTMYIMKGIAWVTTGGNSIHLGLGQDYTFLGRGFLGPFLKYLNCHIHFSCFLFHTKPDIAGKYTYAIGANRRTALSGINVYLRVILYVLVGLLSAFSELLSDSDW